MLKNRLSISSWSLHRCLGPLRWTVWDDAAKTQSVKIEDQPSELELTELPKAAAERGLSFLELCDFHFPSRDETYLTELRRAFDDANVKFHTLLVDYGDISSPDPVRRSSDIQYLKGWIDTAKAAGAASVRIVAGEQPANDKEAIMRSVQALQELERYAEGSGVAVVTENFRELTSAVSSWSQIVDGVGGDFSTIIDFGNLAAAEKEDGVRYGAPKAHSIHAKPDYENGVMNEERFIRMLSILDEMGCDAPVSIIFDRQGNMWEGIERIKQVMLQTT
ncbi:sugar phosphate isomerase/epimerase family protein [Paenibacillus humicola]|uniref:sugar phosphate isomerase/epimerase family protein n=1 Tax=Paenibacillus humicola TaxID=3110540 RepID=UPI00237A3F42|nr:TIM barrel protein [Paenibacillus humicola]